MFSLLELSWIRDIESEKFESHTDNLTLISIWVY